MNFNYPGLDALVSKEQVPMSTLYAKAASNDSIRSMMQNITPHRFSEDEADGIARAIYQAYGKSQKMNISEHIHFLQEKGLSEANAKKTSTGMYLVAQLIKAKQEEYQQGQSSSSGPNVGRVVIGFIIMMVGIALTAGSNSIFYGAIAVGFFMMIGGFIGGSD